MESCMCHGVFKQLNFACHVCVCARVGGKTRKQSHVKEIYLFILGELWKTLCLAVTKCKNTNKAVTVEVV